MLETKQINICDELSQNFIDFSYETNSCRAFADARDGLKPGQRACLWEMFHKGFLSSKPFVKSAKISGGVTGVWWPHGDAAIYDTFTRMSQPWINNIPEVDWHGNNGSQIIPDSAAAARYTEARLSKAIEEGMFKGIKKNVVNMIPNYLEDEEWPEVLPAVLPRLMINGCQGIGSTIANVWLPHNLREIGNLLLQYIKTKEIDYSTIAPDFPTGCLIVNKNDLSSIYTTGKGKVILRARAEIKDDHIYFKELPYQVYLEPLIEKIKDLIKKEELTGIESVFNRSSKKGIEIDIQCSESPEIVLKKLYAKTDLQKSYNANQWALVGKTPKLLTFKDYCEIYIEHNLLCIQKEAKYDLVKAKDRLHIIDGLLRSLEDIDNIINLIKKSASAAAAKESLKEIYQFSDVQAKAIVDMKLGRLAGLEKIELQQEATELNEKIKELNLLSSNKEKQKEALCERLASLISKYGTARRTELTHIDIKPEDKEKAAIIPEEVAVIVSQTGEIKRIPAASFKIQRRKGKGIKTEDKTIMTAFATNTLDTLLIFSSNGKMYRTSVNNIPAGTNVSKGVPISTLIKLDDPSEKIIAVTSLATGTMAKYIIFVTKNGIVKKTALEEYLKTRRNCGIVAINLKDGDSIANIVFVNEEDLVLVTKKGLASHIKTSDIAATGRATIGIKGMKLDDGDFILSAMAVEDENEDLATFLSSGEGKRVSLKELPPQGRNGKGLAVFKAQGKEQLVGSLLVTDDTNLLIIGKPNSICISAKDLPIMSTRTARGNLLIENSQIISVTKI